ncbi:MAG TPA: DUF2059 domain-containing protein [Candidatus Angelobacter sp.]
MKKLVLVFVVTAGVFSFGQTAAAPAPAPAQSPSAPAQKTTARPAASEKPTQEQVLKLLELLRVRESVQISVDAMKEQVRATAEQSLRESVREPTVEQIRQMNAIVDGVFKELVLDDLIQDVVPVYQKHLTRSDVEAVIAFYTTPAGKKILREQSAMIRESMQATAATQQKKMQLLLVKLEVRMRELIQGQPAGTQPEKK